VFCFEEVREKLTGGLLGDFSDFLPLFPESLPVFFSFSFDRIRFFSAAESAAMAFHSMWSSPSIASPFFFFYSVAMSSFLFFLFFSPSLLLFSFRFLFFGTS